MATPTNTAYQAKSPMVFRPTATSPPPGTPVPLTDLEDIAADTILGSEAGGPPEALSVGASLVIAAGAINVADGSKGPITASANGTVWTPNAGTITEAMQVLADNTTQNVSTSAHGYAPKAPNDATKFLNGANPPAYSVPAAKYALYAFNAGGNPAQSTTYYYGGRHGTPAQTSATFARQFFPAAGTVTAIYTGITWITAGSSASQTLYIRVNNTTDYLISNAYDISTGASNITDFGGVALSIAVTAGDYFEIKWVTPVWTTPATSAIWNHTLFIE